MRDSPLGTSKLETGIHATDLASSMITPNYHPETAVRRFCSGARDISDQLKLSADPHSPVVRQLVSAFK